MRTAQITRPRRNGTSQAGAKAKSATGVPELMKAQLLKLLRRGWVTPLVALEKAGCLSFSQRCGEFERQGLSVQRKWVTLGNGKRVKACRVVG